MVATLNILVVEDNHDLREAFVEVLCAQGHRAVGVDSAEAFVEWSGELDLLILDLNLPGEDGLSLARRLRQTHPQLGIIMVTARGMPAEKALGYDSGADIYLAKPVSHDELKAAVQSLARRLKPTAPGRGFQLDTTGMRLVGPETPPVPLTAQQVALIVAFCRAPERRLESWQIIELLAQEEARDPKAAIELHMVRLRKKLAQAGAPAPSIQSIRGWGYQLCTAMVIAA